MKNLLCFGAGFSGLEILKHAHQQGFKVVGCVRSHNKAKHLTQKTGLSITPFDCLDLANINPTHIIHTVPTNGKFGAMNTPHMGSDAVYDTYATDIQKLPNLTWFGYISTTGVYGNTNGAIVDETTPTNPSGKRGKSRVAVEKLWRHTIPKPIYFACREFMGRDALPLIQYNTPMQGRYIKQGKFLDGFTYMTLPKLCLLVCYHPTLNLYIMW